MGDSLEPGAYDAIITGELARQLQGLPAEQVLREAIESELAPEILARHLYFVIRRAITGAPSAEDDPRARLELSNRIVAAISSITNEEVDDSDLLDVSDTPMLWGVKSLPGTVGGYKELESPSVRLSQSALLVNARNQPAIGHELNKELSTADSVDLLCSFVMNTGMNVLERGLSSVVSRGGTVRVLTTTYMGATQKKALDRLSALGAEVRISYDGTTTRLHAKSWLMKRRSGATTAYVGSSNLSHAALIDGIEWNVRISRREQPHIIDTISATFEDYWNDKEFEPYDPIKDGERLIAALAAAGSGNVESVTLQFLDIEVLPRPYQQEVLNELEVEREVHGRFKNLVVMATGTGKTIVAGLDYRRLVDSGEVKSLLFIAHREQILDQSLMTFRTIMREGSFGELYVGGQRPEKWDHVFGSVQSLSRLDLSTISPDAFDMIIVDEFHHAAAETYEKLLTHFKPKVLLGLTATPERSDGKDILHWFGGNISAELRLWEAIDRQILSPFQYFGLNDNIDLESAGITWKRGFGYDITELSNLYTGNDARVALVLEQMTRYVDDISSVKGLGFCVSIEHAEYMAEKFKQAGVPAVSVTSKMQAEDRRKAMRDLRSGEIKVIFAVDIFNEGVDIPEINTLLMLRPTESATVFIQQLGRGLRKCSNKRILTVLDFVGNQNKNFRFDLKYTKLLGIGRKKLIDGIENDFPFLPSGCHFELDAVSKSQILESLRVLLRFNRGYFANDMRTLGDVGLAQYLEESGVTIEDLYKSGRCFALLKKQVFEPDYVPSPIEVEVGRALSRCLHIDDPERVSAYAKILDGTEADSDNPFLLMLGYTLFGDRVNAEGVRLKLNLLRESLLFNETLELFSLLENRRTRITKPAKSGGSHLNIHARYSRSEILAAFGVPTAGRYGTGVIWVPDRKADLVFVDLNKSEKHFSPTTMYADTALSERVFQWESQSVTSSESETGKRYIGHKSLGCSFHLFVRDFKNDPETGVTMPYMYFGPADYMTHVGSRPMRIQWHLENPLPADVLIKSKVLAS